MASQRRQKSAKFQQQAEAVPPLRPLTDKQAEYIGAIFGAENVICLGPAGTGKTFVPAVIAADLFRMNKIGSIKLTRPNITASKSLGYFPGTLEEKIDPWALPLLDTIERRLGKGALEIARKRGDIEVVPFEVMRGRSWDDSFVILDEAQNATPEEMLMFLTRQGEGTRAVICGDIKQCDLPKASGLTKVIHLVKARMLPVPIIEFGIDDIVRSSVCRMWIEAFDKG